MAITITTEYSKMDFDLIHGYLKTAYWCEGIPKETLKRAMENSLCFGIFQGQGQIGFARVVSDFATYAYLCDVFILEKFRGQGHSKKLMEEIMKHPKLQELRRFTLATKDAHGLYTQFGFSPLKIPDRFMEIHRPGVYGHSQ